MIDAVSDNQAYVLLQKTIGHALESLGPTRLSDKRLHAARKAIKKARAAIRLLRPAMEEIDYRMENDALRDVGRSLFSLRDASSVLDAFNALASRYSNQMRGVELGPLHRWMLAKRKLARNALVHAPAQLHHCVDSLEGCRGRMRRSKLAHPGPATTTEGLRRIYRKGRKAFARAGRARTSEVLHEWRKQVKYLLNAVAAMGDPIAHRSRKLSRRADRIARWLGDDHDLAMLHDAIREYALAVDIAAILNGLIALRRAKLQEHALHEGRKLFARKPKRLVARM